MRDATLLRRSNCYARTVITALFEFTRASARAAPTGVTASTDAHAVLLNWSMAPERSFHPVLDLPDLLVASLTWDERNDAASRNDLDSWCHRLGISVSSALRMALNDQQDPVDLLSPN